MTYRRFSQLWRALITDRAVRPRTNTIVVPGVSAHTEAALIAASKGDFTAFDRIQKELDKVDALEHA